MTTDARQSETSANDAMRGLMREFLEWVALRPRTCVETMDAWRSTCPRLSVWEDALAEGLIRVQRPDEGAQPHVFLTSQGEALLGLPPKQPTH